MKKNINKMIITLFVIMISFFVGISNTKAADNLTPGNLGNQTPEGWYMCNTTIGASKKQSQACVKKTKKDSIVNCEKEVFDSKLNCETKLKVVTVTTTTTTKKTRTTKKNTAVTGGAGCTDVRDLIHEYWSDVMVLVPILLIVMITLDFFKALAKGDSDSIKKAGSNAVKRTVAAVVLLALPALLGVIFNLVGLPLCV